MKQGYGSEQTMAALQKTTLNIHCHLQLKIDIKKYNNVHIVLNKTKYRLYNQKPNKLSVLQEETKQKISCTSINKTKYQLYKHKQNKRSVVQAETKQKISCTSRNKTKD